MIFAVALIAVALAAHPTESPKEKGVPKGESAQSAAKPESTSKPQEPPQPSNPPTAPTPPGTSQTTANAGESKRDAETENQNIQRRIEIFTGLLVIVGFIQAGVMALQWLIYCRQARIMAHQAGEMTRQRLTMNRQLEAMRSQLQEMATQTGILNDSVAHAGTSAESALRSVKLQEAQLRQWVNIEDLDLKASYFQPPATTATLSLSFRIVNNTKMLLTLKEIATKTFDDSEFTPNTLDYALPPEDDYPYKMDIEITGKSLQDYQSARFVIPLVGLVAFEDAFGILRHQGFGFDCHCGPQNWFEFRIHEGEIPKKKSGEAN